MTDLGEAIRQFSMEGTKLKSRGNGVEPQPEWKP